MKQIVIVVISILFLVQWTCNVRELENFNDLPICYYTQDDPCWCGIANIQMWASWDGIYVSQQEIANAIGVTANDTASPYLLHTAVGYFTGTDPYMPMKTIWDVGGQGDVIAATITGIKHDTPSIMPFNDADHTVLIKGYKWKYDSNGKPYAIRVFYHDPWYGDNLTYTAYELVQAFDPAPLMYWAIIGFEEYWDEGVLGHDTFVVAGGTYYGGPPVYNPKGLTPDPSVL